jgi:MFS family permease
VPKPSNPQFKVRSLIFSVYLPSALFSSGEAALFPIIPSRAESFGAGLALAGLIAGLFLVGTLLMDVPAAHLVQRFGERNCMIVASALGTLAAIAAGFASNLWLLGAGILVLGGMASVFGLARHGYMADNVPVENRARALSVLGGMFRFGMFFGPLLGSALVATIGLQGTFWMSAILCALSCAVLLFSSKDEVASREQHREHSTWQVAKQERRSLATLGVASAILAVLRTTRTIGLPLWGLFIGLHPALISLYVGLSGLLDFALFYFSGQVMDKFGRRWAAIPTLIGLAFAQFMLVFAHDGAGFLWAAILMSFANGLGSGIIMTIGADAAPANSRTEYLASFRLLVDIGQAVTSPLISVITVVAGLSSAMVGIGALSLVGAAMMWRWLPNWPSGRVSADKSIS